MVERITERKIDRFCDRCNAPVPKFDDLRTLRKLVSTETRLRWAVAYFGNRERGAQILVSDIDFCQSCWNEFLDLFLQGKAVHSVVKSS